MFITEVGGGIGMGKTCKTKAVSFQYMTKFTTNKKKKKRRRPLRCNKKKKSSLHLFSSMGIMKCNESTENYCIGVSEEGTRTEQN